MKRKILEAYNYFTLASAFKIAVMAYQRVPKDTSLYFTLSGYPQTVNEHSIFGYMMINSKMECCNEFQ